ncbi:hypothetical protein VEHBASIW_CDS0020 [Salmonella phage vB_SalP_QS]
MMSEKKAPFGAFFYRHDKESDLNDKHVRS